jgi:Outer membrane protein beta-barrel domain
MFKGPLLCTSVITLMLGTPAAAWAQSAAPSQGCPPGSWFCAETTQAPAPPPGAQVVQVQTAPAQPPPPVVVYQPPPPVVVYEQPGTHYYAVPPPPPPPVYYYRPKYRRRGEWGINLHLEGAALGHASNVPSGGSMWGGGFGLRYRPVPVFALETDLDFVGGVDYQDRPRTETATTINGLFFLNPKSRAQVYLLAGFGWSWAHVSADSLGDSYDYDYFGGQGGLGLEFRVSKHFALNFDARAFIRTRIDDNTIQPEFVSTTGQTTNTSAGGLFTGGMTFYF